MQSGLDKSDLEHILLHTEHLWGDVRGKNLFVSGGTGFFGKWLVESFLWANERLNLGATITVLTRRPDAFLSAQPHLSANENLKIVQGDVRDFCLTAPTHYELVIHAATEASLKLTQEDPFQMLSTIVDGTARMINFARQCGTEKFLLTSSGAVYGRQPSEMLRMCESYTGGPNPLQPEAVYAEGKRMAEHLCSLHACQTRIEFKIARCFAFVGPYLPLDTHFAIGNFIRDTLERRPIRIMGDGTPTRSYLYAADLAIWLWTILLKGQPMKAYNVGSDESMSIHEVAEIVTAALQADLAIEVCKPPVSGQPISRYVPDTTLARTELGLKQWIDIMQAVQKTAAWNNC